MQEQITREPVVFRVARSARGLVGWRPEISAASLNYKPRTRFGVGLIGFVFCVANAAVFTAAVAPFLKGEQSYSDLVGSAIAWGNVDKGFDFRVFQVFLATFGLLVALLVSLCRRLETSHEMKAALERGLALALTPGALWLGGRLVTNSFGSAPIDCVLSGAAVLTLFFLLSRPRLAATPENIGAIVNASLLGLVLAFFAGLGLATAISRIFHAPITKDTTIWLVTATCGSAFLAVATVILLSSQAAEIRERIRHVIFGSQIFLPLLCTVIVPPAVVENGNRIVAHPSIALTTGLVLAMAAGWAALSSRWIWSRHPTAANLRQSLVPWAILPVAVFLAVDHPAFPTFFGDDFHTGEHLLPWQQLRDFGKLPFVGFVPIHPLMDFFVSGANQFFFDGTLANYENSRVLLFAVGAALTFITVTRFAGIGLALCLSIAATVWDRLLLVPTLLAVLCDASLIGKSQRWLLCWLCLCALALCYNPAVGVALTLASLPVAIVQVWRLFRQDRNGLVRLTIVCGSVVAAILLTPAAREISWGFVRFLIDNGRTVLVAHGIEWQANAAQMSSVRGVLASPLVWETLRFSWVIVLLLSGWIFLSRAHDWRNARPSILAISATTCLFLFFLSGWTLTRIDPSLPSRPGEVSYLACLYILPLVLFSAGSWRYISIPLFMMLIGFFQGATADFINSGSKPHFRVTTGALLEKPATTQTVPDQCISVDGNSLGLRNLGHIYAPKEIVASVVGLKRALSTLLRPGETYLDLTNRQANYFYLGMPAAVSYGAPWVTANTVLQDRLLAEIKSQPPPVVWLTPALALSVDMPAARMYKLYRFLLENYVPLSRDGYFFLVAPDRVGNSNSVREDQIKLLHGGLGDHNLGRLPAAWGSSWSKLETRFTRVQQLSTASGPITNGAGVSLSCNDRSPSGAETDFIKFDFSSNLLPTAKMELDITWTSEHGFGVARLLATGGTNLVPLGAFPAWLLSRNISDVKIAPHAPPSGLVYAIEKVALMRLKD